MASDQGPGAREERCYSCVCRERDLQAERCLIYLRWSDASYQVEKMLGFADLCPGVIIESGGLLVRETETHYSLALDFYPGEETWRHVIHVPKINVLQVVKWPWPEGEEKSEGREARAAALSAWKKFVS